MSFAAKRLLSAHELRARALELRSRIVDSEVEVEDADRQGLVPFQIDGAHLAVSVSAIQEVVTHLRVTPVPLTPAFVAGMVNLRGEILWAIDLSVFLGLTPTRARDPGKTPPFSSSM